MTLPLLASICVIPSCLIKEVAVAVPVDPCVIPEAPTPPALEFDEQGNLTPDSAILEGTFRRRARDYIEAVEACELITHEGA